MLWGTLANMEVLLPIDTVIPPAGAASLSVTVPVEGLPPVTVVGFSESDDRVTGTAVMVSEAVLLTPL
jgi:hypothetical protein